MISYLSCSPALSDRKIVIVLEETSPPSQIVIDLEDTLREREIVIVLEETSPPSQIIIVLEETQDSLHRERNLPQGCPTSSWYKLSIIRIMTVLLLESYKK